MDNNSIEAELFFDEDSLWQQGYDDALKGAIFDELMTKQIKPNVNPSWTAKQKKEYLAGFREGCNVGSTFEGYRW